MTKDEGILYLQKKDHTVVRYNFFGKGMHLEAWQLGWDLYCKVESKSSVSKKIFDYYIQNGGMNMIFYYLGDDNFYGIHGEEIPTPIFRFKKISADYTIDEIGTQDTHSYQQQEILYMVENNQEIWSSVTINGKTMEEIIQNSYIINIS